uniref:Xanthine dehydrogenase/oxidase n=1 Tax=Cyprinus carpio TaxID=7962 RepID=A0A8C1ZSZ9_CYPCA
MPITAEEIKNKLQSPGDDLVFFVNGKKITEKNAEPEKTLLTYLRRNLGLTGTKLGCAEGGCGACTVMRIAVFKASLSHYAVNACLAPLCSLHHCAVTTVEGIGSVASKLHPVQERIAKAHGSQCGFCTPGIVMSMYALLRNNPQPSMHDVQEAFQGNLCRCTGYRPILEGYRSFTKDGGCCGGKAQSNGCCMTNEHTQEHVNKLYDQSEFMPLDPTQEIIFPPELMVKQPQRELRFAGERVLWIQPCSLEELLELKATYPNAKLVVGNTEVGIEMKFKNLLYPVILAPAYIPELNIIQNTQDGIQVGASVTLTVLGDVLRAAVKKLPAHQTEVFKAVLEQLRWFAGQQIRNVAVCHVPEDSEIKFYASREQLINKLNVQCMFYKLYKKNLCLMFKGEKHVIEMDGKFFPGYRKTILKPEEILLSIEIPYTRKVSFKQSPRKEDDIAIVTCGMNVFFKEQSNIVQSIRISYGGMAPVTVLATATCNRLLNRQWNEELLEEACTSLAEEMNLSPSAPGGMVTYRRTLTISLFYKFFLNVQHKLSLDLLKEVFNIVFFVVVVVAIRRLLQKHFTFPSSTCKDLQQGDSCMLYVTCVGHIVGAIVADTQAHAQRAAKAVKISYEELQPVIVTIQDAIANKSFFQPVRSIERGDVAQGFKDSDHILHGEMHIGGQEQFYLETNCTLAVPRGEDGEMELFVSTQSASKTQALVAKALGVSANRVVCRVKRMGGGFGGKESRSTILSTVVAVAAHTVKRPVRCMLDRDEDMLVTGGRHPFFGHYKVGYMNNGRVMALEVTLYSNAGNSLDLSLSILERALFHMDNSYNIPNIRGTGYVCKTNLPSNSAFRGFGGPQGMMIAESWMSDVALSCGLPAEEVRRMNMYKEGDFTPFSQRLDNFTIDRCWEECMQLSDFNKRKDAVEQYNRLEITMNIEIINSTKSLCSLKRRIVRKHVFFDILRIIINFIMFYRTPDLGYDFETNSGRPFNYFSYGVAVSEVEIDCLTGSHKNLHTSIVMDVGKSLNPALDIGQVEGGFMQGLGLFTLEELRYSPDGYLYTRGPGMYKIPAFGDIPIELKVSLLRDAPNEKAIFSSKAVGEPPLFLAASVFYAIKDAITAARAESNLTGPFRLDSPCPPADPGTFIPWAVQV